MGKERGDSLNRVEGWGSEVVIECKDLAVMAVVKEEERERNGREALRDDVWACERMDVSYIAGDEGQENAAPFQTERARSALVGSIVVVGAVKSGLRRRTPGWR